MYACDYLTQCYIYTQVNTISSNVKVTLHEHTTYSFEIHNYYYELKAL